MIQDNYYAGFVSLCKKNKNMKHIPLKEDLESLGCDISAMCYLVLDGGGIYNPATINPEIIGDEKVALLFKEGRSMIEKSTKKEPELLKICDICKDKKPIKDFRRKPGRGLNYHTSCLSCEVKDRTGKMKSLSEEKKVKAQIQKPDLSTTTKVISQSQKSIPIAKPVQILARYISVERAKELVLEAYNIGLQDATEKMCTSDISLSDLLGSDAEQMLRGA